MDQLANLNFLC